MFVGHGTLAFAVVGMAASAAGVERERALALGVAAGLFATLPDVDMVYALTGLLHGPLFQPVSLAESFWAASTVVHRSITHSLLVAAPSAMAFSLLGRSRLRTAVGAVVAAGVVAVAFLTTGPIGGLVASAFVIAGSLVGIGAARYGLAARPVAAAALFGVVSHPFGDVLTGRPPKLFYPLDVTVLQGRVVLSTDPTLHLLGAFGIELLAIWLGVFAFAHLRETSVWTHVRPRAVFGSAYAMAVLAIPPPTLALSYPFVFSVLGVGLIGAVPLRRRLPTGWTAATTGLAGVTVASAAYTLAYLAAGL